VQDRYAGDLGDFLKFGLLRWLAPPGRPASPRLGAAAAHAGYLPDRLTALADSPWGKEPMCTGREPRPV